MTDDAHTPARRPWKRWLALAVFVGLVLLLYPQLKDLGGELYRFFS